MIPLKSRVFPFMFMIFLTGDVGTECRSPNMILFYRFNTSIILDLCCIRASVRNKQMNVSPLNELAIYVQDLPDG